VSTGKSDTSLTCSILHSFPQLTSKLPSSVLFWKKNKSSKNISKTVHYQRTDQIQGMLRTIRSRIFCSPVCYLKTTQICWFYQLYDIITNFDLSY
jgi:hypothetical protein